MAQIKVYGIKEKLASVRELLSEVIHECVMEALQFPADKKTHRFSYTIITRHDCYSSC